MVETSYKTLLNIRINDSTTHELLATMRQGVVLTPNTDHLILLQSDKEFYDAYQNANVVLLDSQVLLFLARLAGIHFREKISGSDFFPKYCEYHRLNQGIKIFVLGGLDGVAEKVMQVINTQYQSSIIVGAFSPSYGFENNLSECSEVVERINSSGANVLAVGLGAPKQEKWVHQYKKSLPKVDLFMCIGATLDFIAGKERRAPVVLQKIGLEWAFRLFHQPRKLFYRYLIRDMKIFYYFLLVMMGRYVNPFAAENE